MNELIDQIIDEHQKVVTKFMSKDNRDVIERMVRGIVSSFESGGKLLIFGNGGSAADAQHISAEFLNRFKIERPPLPAIALTTDSSTITAIGNDYSYDDAFLKQVQALANKNDVVLGISTSGNSENVVRALRYAFKKGVKTYGFGGDTGGKMPGLCDELLTVPSKTTARIQECHIIAAHLICELVDERMFGTLR